MNMNAAIKLEKNSAYGKVGCPGGLVSKETRDFVLSEVERGVTCIEVTPTAIIRHFDFRSKYPAALSLDAPIPYTLTAKAEEYFSGKKTP